MKRRKKICKRAKKNFLNHILLKIVVIASTMHFFNGSVLAQNGHTTYNITGDWEAQSTWHFDQYNPPNYNGNLTGQGYSIYGNITRNGDISTGTGIDIYGTLTVTGTVTNGGGSLTVKNGGTLIVNGDFNITSNVTVESGGTLIVYGDMHITGGSVSMSGNVVVRGDFYINNSGTTVTNSGNLVVGGDFNFAGGGFNVSNTSQSVYIFDPTATVNTPNWNNDICDASKTTCTYGNSSTFYDNETSPLTDIVSQVFGCLWGQPSSSNSCAGGTALFSSQASAGCAYQWQISTNNGVTWNNVSSIAPYSGVISKTLSVSPVTASMNNYQFRCLVSGGSCSETVTSRTVTLTVNNPPVITTQPLSVSPCTTGYYSNISFSVGATGANLSYQWQESTNGTSWSNVPNSSPYFYNSPTSNSLQIYGGQIKSNIFYRCIVINSNGCSVTSNVATLAITAASAAGAITGSPAACKGQTGIPFQVPLISGATSYVWAYSGGGATIHGTSNSITVDFSSTATDGNLTVLGSNSCGAGTKSGNYGIVINAVPVITTQPADITQSAGSTASFNVGATGTGLSYQWRKNGTNIMEATSTVLNITNISNSDAGSYDVLISNGSCSVVSAVAMLTVVTVVAPTSASSDRNNYCADGGGNITLTATGGSGTVLKWYRSSCGGILVGTGTPLILIAPTFTTSYYARWESDTNYSSCASITVTVESLPNTGELYRKPNN